MPRRPSIEANRAVSSPQTNAPAPSFTATCRRKPLPITESPSSPRSVERARASLIRSTASGYSARM